MLYNKSLIYIYIQKMYPLLLTHCISKMNLPLKRNCWNSYLVVILNVRDLHLWKSAMGDIYNQGTDSHFHLKPQHNLNE